MKKAMPAADRFWLFVPRKDPAECWNWRPLKGGAISQKYPSFSVGGKPVLAHRFSYEIHKGPIPKGMCVMHLCDNTTCVNPSHLQLGTHMENMRDKMAKGRGGHRRGNAHHNAKLTEVAVAKAKAAMLAGASAASVARALGINPATAQRIRAGSAWAHVRAMEP